MALADDLQGDIAAVLDDPDYGRDIVIIRTPPGTYDAATGTSVPAAPVEYPTRGLLLSYRDRSIDGTLIRQGDRKCIVKVLGLAVEPAAGWRVRVAADTYTIMNDVKKSELGGTAFLFVLQLRKGG